MNTNVNIKNRNSSIELLKILGLIFIVLSHSVPCYGDKNAISFIDNNLATQNISEFILIVLGNLGQVGNLFFIMGSAYFLLDKNTTRMKKVAYIIADCFIISIISLLIHLLCGVKLNVKDIFTQFFPITFNKNWFVGCYLLLYIIHPFLNKIIITLKKENLLRINIVFLILYAVINMIHSGHYYYTNLVGFIVIYFIVAYDKLYLQKFSQNTKANIRVLIFAIIMFLGLLIVTNLLGLKINLFEDKMMHWNSIMNIFGILIGITLLNIASNKSIINKKINYLSSLSLLFYVIHENDLFRYYTKPLFYQWGFSIGGNIVLWVLLEALLLFLFGMILSAVYKLSLQKIIYKITDNIFDIFSNIWSKIEKKLLLLN